MKVSLLIRVILLTTITIAAPHPTLAVNCELQYVSPDKFLGIWSDHKTNEDKCKSIAKRTLDAYQFDNRQESWTNQNILWNPPLRMEVLNSMKKDDYGVAVGKGVFMIANSYLDDSLSEGTLAHELTHIQDRRQLDGGSMLGFL